MQHRFPHRWRTRRMTFSADRAELSWKPCTRTSGTSSESLTHIRAVHHSAADSDPLAELRAERPGQDGIRHGLVARVKELIAEGAYDTPERWEAAEEQLLRRIERRC